MTLQLITLVVAIFANTLLGITGLYRKPKAAQTWLFFFLALALNGWLTANYLSLQVTDPLVTYTILTWLFAFVILQNTAYLFFVLQQTGHPLGRRVRATYLIASVVLTAMALAGFLFGSSTHEGSFNIVPNWGMPAFVLHAIISIGVGFWRIISSQLKTRGAQRNQLRYLLLSSIILFILVPFANFLLPVVFSNQALLVFAPIFSIASSFLIAYAMFKHHLFDIRTLVVRAVVYIGALVTLAPLYVWVVFNVGTTALERSGLQEYLEVFYILTIILVGMSFHQMKIFFDRLTNRVFFQDAYDTKIVLNQITSVLVRTVSVDELMRRSLTVLKNSLKVEYVIAVVGDVWHEDTWHEIRVGKESPNLEPFISEMKKAPRSLVVLDETDDTTRHLYRVMQAADMSVITRLETSKETIGYIFFGYKESGNIYNSQDIELVRIASDELAVAIQNAMRFEEIEHFNERLQAEVRDATAELRTTNRKLHALDQAKDDFISMASHQLRTPLTSIKGYLSMVLEGDMGNVTATQRKVLEEAYTSSQRMVYLIGDFLNVSRIQTGKFELERTQANLAAILTDEIDQLRAMAQSRSLKIEYTPPSRFPTAYIDQDKFRQVMMNFIDNAIYYSHANAAITIQITKDANDIVFKVTDQGIGVPADERHKLFTKFYRASNAKRQRPDGTGIGLFMAQKVIVAHGGSVIFESRENQGSTFGFRLPLKGNTK